MRIGLKRYRGKLVRLGAVAIAGLMTANAAGLVYPGRSPGPAHATVENNALRLSNRMLDIQWQVHGTRLQPVLIRNRITDQILPVQDCDGFALILADGTIARSADLQTLEAPHAVRLAMGKLQGFETGAHGFLLAGTNYHARFLETCAGFIRDSGLAHLTGSSFSRSRLSCTTPHPSE